MFSDAKILLDSPSSKPALGFESASQALSEIIQQSSPRFVIGIFGPWGSGKTTLMRDIERKLDPKLCMVLQFSAWRYEKEANLIVPLLDVVREGLVDWADKHQAMKQNALSVASTIGKVVYSLMAGFSFKAGLPSALEVSFDANKALTQADKLDDDDVVARVPRSFYYGAFQTLAKSFKKFLEIAGGPDRIVIFVDDLDRCLPQGALEVLEAMKLFFDLDGFVFVVGLDRKVIERAVDLRYNNDGSRAEVAADQRIGGADYVKKIFQVPFSVAPMALGQLDEFLENVRTEANLPVNQWNDLQQNVAPHLRYILADATVNPREVKRFINAYTLAMKIKPKLNSGALLALQTVAFRIDWAGVNQAILSYREAFIDALKNRINQGDTNAFADLDPRLVAIPESFVVYVSFGNPGAALFSIAGNLEVYIYSGESTRGSVNTLVLDAIRDTAEAARMLREMKTGLVTSEVYMNIAFGLQDRLLSFGPQYTAVVNEWKAHLAPPPPTLVEGLRAVSYDDLSADQRTQRNVVEDWRNAEEGIVRRVQTILMESYRLQSAGSPSM